MPAPGILSNAARALRWSYDAVSAKSKRKQPTGILRNEDSELTPPDRKKLVSAARDLQRNYTVAAWMIRRHLDYVTTFRFQARTESAALNAKAEALMRNWGRRENVDVARRHPLRRMVRLAEARAVVDGDVVFQRLATGKLQAIEGDRVRTPTDGGSLPPPVTPANVIHGVQVDDVGAAVAYSICRRGPSNDFAPNGGTFVFERLLPATDCFQHGFFDRFDQVRGISPLAAGLNNLRDSYEGIDYALAKAKLAQLFGLAFFRGDPNTIGERDSEATDYKKLRLDGPTVLDLDVGDRAEWLESKTPSTEFAAFQVLVIQLALKALDIPFSFFNESFTNYSGSRGALLQYEQSAGQRRLDVADLLDWLTEWRLDLWQADRLLTAGERESMRHEWVHASVPWLDPLKETQADIANLSAGLTCRRDLLKQQGKEWEEVVAQLAKENKVLASLGLPTSVVPDNALIKELVSNDA